MFLFFFFLLLCDCFFNDFVHSFLHRWKKYLPLSISLSLPFSPSLSLSLSFSLCISFTLNVVSGTPIYLQNVIVISLLPFSFAYSVRQIFIERRPLNARSYVSGYKIIRIIREKNECIQHQPFTYITITTALYTTNH